MKNKIWKLEYTITLFILFGTILILLPVSITQTSQARLISRWNEQYNRADYMFSVIKANIDEDTERTFEQAKGDEDRNLLAIQLIQPYLRIDTSKKVSKFYKIRYMDKSKVLKGQEYYFDNLHYMEKNIIVGIKNVKTENKNLPVYKMMFDLNGKRSPNTWGKDIFGIDVYSDSTIKPFGEGLSMDALEKDCSSEGSGVTCSYYYKIGGAFDEKI